MSHFNSLLLHLYVNEVRVAQHDVADSCLSGGAGGPHQAMWADVQSTGTASRKPFMQSCI